MYEQQKIGVIIPAYNVEAQIRQTIENLPEIIDRIYVVDDGSTDNTVNAIGHHNGKIRVLIHQANMGPGAALSTGYRAALEEDMDIVVKVDGDGQMPSDHIPDMLVPIIEKRADYTKGDRLSNPDFRKTMPRFRLVGNYLLTYLTRIASGFWNVYDTQNGFVAISKRALGHIGYEDIYPYYGYLNDILVRLKVFGLAFQDVPMPARYGEEKSSIRLNGFIPKVSFLLLRRFLWRMRTRFMPSPAQKLTKETQKL